MEEDGTSSTMDISNEGNQNDVANVEDRVEEPRLDMLFNNIDEIYNYYRTYGMKMGFGVARRSSRKVEGSVTYVTIGCNRYGKSKNTSQNGKSKNTSQNVLSPHPITKTDCRARVCAKLLEDGKWCVSTVVIGHNHSLIPGRSPYYRCNRKSKTNAKRKVESTDRADTKMKKDDNAFVAAFVGHENLPSLEKDCQNHILKVSQLKLGEGGGAALQSYFKKMQEIDSNFFYLIDVDEDNRLRNLFWADGRCRATYEEFGEVITFDTTYLTSKYDVPFVAFLGVNHHGHSMLLGCGLISSECTNTFVWLFDSLLACMSGLAPSAIITDQSPTMQTAIEKVFPRARHRWCLWHLMKKILEIFRGYEQYESLKSCLQNVVYDSISCDEFEIGWNTLVEKYAMVSNELLVQLYNERCRWAPCFVKDCFWAGMSTMHRSESVNVFFDGYINAMTTLKDFFEQYENALRSKVAKEKDADFKSFNSWIPCVTFYEMEKQLQDVYTISKFKEFQQELTSIMYCQAPLLESQDSIFDCEVSELQNFGENKEYKRRVKFKVHFAKEEGEAECEVKCSCQLFESRGILCRHILRVLVDRDIFIIPNKYVLQRWRKNVKRRYTKTRVSYSDWKDTDEGRRYDRICQVFHEVADIACDSEDRCNQLVERLLDLKDDWSTSNSVCASNE